MTDAQHLKFATDLVTYDAPTFWGGAGGLDASAAAIAAGQGDPVRFGERVLDATRDAGLHGTPGSRASLCYT